MKAQSNRTAKPKQNRSCRKLKSARVPRSRLQPWDVHNVFRLAAKHAPHILPAMMFEFVERYCESKIFALTWSAWDGQCFRTASSADSPKSSIVIHRKSEDHSHAVMPLAPPCAFPSAPKIWKPRTTTVLRGKSPNSRESFRVGPVIKAWLNATAPVAHSTLDAPHRDSTARRVSKEPTRNARPRRLFKSC